MSTTKGQTHRFHFDLQHCKQLDQDKFYVICGNASVPLTTHRDESRALARNTNRAFAMLSEENQAKFTHYAELTLENEEIVQFARAYSEDSGPLPILAGTAIIVPDPTEEERKTSNYSYARAPHSRLPHYKLSRYGITEPVDEATHNDATRMFTPLDTAISIVKMHSQIAAQKAADSRSLDAYINDSTPGLYNLATVLSSLGIATEDGGFATICPEVDPKGNPMRFETATIGHEVGDIIYRYDLNDKVLDALRQPLSYVLQQTANDESQKGKMWDVRQEHTAREQQNTPDHPHEKSFVANFLLSSGAQDDTDGYKFTLDNISPGHGISFEEGSLDFEGSKFSIDVHNKYLRTLSAYVKFFREDGSVIKQDDPTFYESQEKRFVKMVSAVNTVLAIPTPTDPITLGFDWPTEATKADIILGSLGTSNWDETASAWGGIFTGILQYATSIFMMVAGAAVQTTKFYKKFLEEEELYLVPALALLEVLFAGVVTPGGAEVNSNAIFASAAEMIAGILLTKAFAYIWTKLLLWVTGAAAASAVPFIGWGIRVFNVMVSAAALAETTVQVLMSPASTILSVARSFDMQVTVGPDPTHGQWPSVATHWQMVVQYKGSETNTSPFIAKASFPTTTTSDPVVHTFQNIPGGGQLKITFVVFSERNWIAGKWESKYMDALLPPGQSVLNVEGEIKENLVPLDSTTQYLFKQKLVYDKPSAAHVWKDGPIPTALVNSLDTGNIGHNIGKLIGITINKNYQVGYAWQASEQGIPLEGQDDPYSGQQYTFQNISGLDQPESTLKFVDQGYGNAVHLAYNQYSLDEAYAVVPFSANPNEPTSYSVHKLDISSSGSGFNIDYSHTYGVFSQVNTIDRVCIHSQGYIIGIQRAFNKMLVLKLPSAPTDFENPAVANMFGGKGQRQGLFHDPAAISIGAGGEILVLEAQNQRVQALTPAGSPCPKFEGTQKFQIASPTTSLLADIQGGKISAEVRNTFFSNEVALTQSWSVIDPKGAGNFTIKGPDKSSGGPYTVYQDSEVKFELSSGDWLPDLCSQKPTSALIDQFESNEFTLSAAAKLTDSVNIRNISGKTNDQFVVKDGNAARSYVLVLAKSNEITVSDYDAFFALQRHDANKITFLDLAVEIKGYIYILYYVEEGTSLDQYRLDLYDPLGAFLSTTPDTSKEPTAKGIPSNKITVDIWRNLLTLNYEVLLGPGDRTEPSVGYYIPTTPEGI